MTKLTEATKARKMHAALAQLAHEYAISEDVAERACSTTVHKAMMDLPDYSKARLYDILQTAQ